MALSLAVGLPIHAALAVAALLQVAPAVDALPRLIGVVGVPPFADNLDAWLVPLLSTAAVVALCNSALVAGEVVRGAPRGTQRLAAGVVVALGALAGACLYYVLGWALPRFSQGVVFPAGLDDRAALEAHPFLLTTPELLDVQRVFRASGGWSARVALTLELRVWLAVSVPAAGLVAAAVTFGPGPALLRAAALAVACFAFLTGATFLTAGPVLFLVPVGLPQAIAWVLLLAITFAAGWHLRDPGSGAFSQNGGPS